MYLIYWPPCPSCSVWNQVQTTWRLTAFQQLSAQPAKGAHAFIVDASFTIEGWPLPTVDIIETNGDSWSTYERGPSSVGSLGSSCRYNRFRAYLGCSNQPSKKYFSLTAHFFILLVPVAQHLGHWADSRAVSPVSVSLVDTWTSD
jgi:hypothetical protein